MKSFNSICGLSTNYHNHVHYFLFVFVVFCYTFVAASYFDRRLASAWHYAYDVIEMCAPVRRQRHL